MKYLNPFFWVGFLGAFIMQGAEDGHAFAERLMWIRKNKRRSRF